MKILKVFVIFSFIFLKTLSAQQGEPITVTGDQLIGSVVNGITIREVVGNVVMRQGNVVITCNRAIQYIAANNAHLIGDVVVRQDTLTIYTPEGYYYGNEKRAYSDQGVKLDDKKVILTAQVGEYFFNGQKAHFRSNVVLYDTASTLNSDELLYFRNENRAVAISNVKITDKDNTIYADSLIHFRNKRITYGYDNIKIINKADNVTVSGNRIEDYRDDAFSKVEGETLLIQIDSVKSSKKDSVLAIDTLIIRASRMEVYRKDEYKFYAIDSVRILRGSFASRNDYTLYNKSEEQLLTYKTSDTSHVPILWYEDSQLSGDSISITLNENRINKIHVFRNSLATSINEKFPRRYDQISGSDLTMSFRDNKLYQTEVFNNVLSIYYLYEDGEPSGLVKASARNAVIIFEDGVVNEVHLSGEPKSEYHPENLIQGNEKQYTIPGFIIYGDKPVKEQLIPGQSKNFKQK